ncbi:LuxR-family transcriptional regulator [Streptomyces sp. e14]|nr:LuxR-family transcriptional regulator [Streptomyces sp. e14]
MLGTVENRSVSPVFVGRQSELGTLNDALARAAAGEPQALLLGGEAGVGKTRLIEEFAAAATRRGAVVALGGCVEIGADGLPFAPFSTALRALRRALPGEFAAAAAGQEEELARLLPELGGDQAAARGAGRHDEEGMARLFELTARLLERIAAGHTVVLVLEDLHWADASTRHLLAYLLRTLRTGRLLVLASYRSDDIHRRHPLRPLLAELDRLRTIHRIELARFTRQEVARQIAGILAAEPDPAQIDQIFERSDGNAFFVEELACCTGPDCPDLSDSLRDLLLVRVEALPETAQRVVRIAAEGGSTVEYRLLAAVSRLAEDDLIEALRAAVNANVLIPAPSGDGYRFRHSLVREAVSDDLLPGERSRLDRRYAEALEADPTLVPADQRVTRLASYWYHAHDPAKALPAVLDASVAARSRHAYSEQLRLLERAMELWDTAPEEVGGRLHAADYVEAYLCCGGRRCARPAALPRPAGRGHRRGPAVRRAGARHETRQAGAAPAGRGGRPAARRLVLGPALPAGPAEVPRRRLAGTGHRAGPGARTAALGGARRGAGPRRQLVHGPHPRPRSRLGGRARRGVRAHGRRPRDRDERPAHPRRPHGRRRGRRDGPRRDVRGQPAHRGRRDLRRRRPLLHQPALRTGGRRPLPRGPAAAGEGPRLHTRPRPAGPRGLGVGQLRRVPVQPGPLGRGRRGGGPLRAHRAQRQAGRLPRQEPRRTRPRPRRPAGGGPPTGRGAGELRQVRARPAARHSAGPAHHRRRRGRGPAARCPRRTRTGPGARLPARHPPLRLARPAHRRHHGGPRRRPARRRPRPHRHPRTGQGRRPHPAHRGARLAGVRELGARRTRARRRPRPARGLDRRRRRLRDLRTPLRPRPRPLPPGRGPARRRGRRRTRPGHGTAAPGARRRRPSGRPPARRQGGAARPRRPALPGRRPGAAGRRRRPRRVPRPHPPGTGRAAPGRAGPHQPPDSRGAVHLPEDGQRPRLQHPRQARRLGPRRGGGGGAPAGSVRPRHAPRPGGRMSRTVGRRPEGSGPCSTPSRNCSRQGASTPRTSRTGWS